MQQLKVFSISNVIFYNICGQLNKIPQINLNRVIEKEIKNFKPEIILTHSDKDLNLDHKTISDPLW